MKLHQNDISKLGKFTFCKAVRSKFKKFVICFKVWCNSYNIGVLPVLQPDFSKCGISR